MVHVAAFLHNDRLFLHGEWILGRNYNTTADVGSRPDEHEFDQATARLADLAQYCRSQGTPRERPFIFASPYSHPRLYAALAALLTRPCGQSTVPARF